MTAPARLKRSRRLALLAITGGAAVLALACGPEYREIPLETPLQPKIDVSPFERVLVAGFVAGGTEALDANQETVRLLRSQLRTRSALKVIDADVMPLLEIMQDQTKPSPARDSALPGSQVTNRPEGDRVTPEPLALPKTIKGEKDLEPYERIFANTAYWKKIGEEYQNPLIVTGTILFTPQSRSGFVQREQEEFDQFGRRRVVPVRTYLERTGFILRPKFIFIDGRTGVTMYSETYREEILYNAQQNTPALSSYFELMDRLVPNFLGTLTAQKIKGTRVLMR
jgi:hypothetical protein